MCGEEELVRRLRRLGLFRRAAEPPAAIVREMLTVHEHRLACDGCGAAAVNVRLGGDGSDDSIWEQVVVCEICRQAIPAERLKFAPTATRCAACQTAVDRGQAGVPAEYCPRCGSLLELRVSRSNGITRYKQFCTGNPPCRLS
ncbi:MAG TPA: TraR/DksA C4-type zinc finger protein [Lacipirellulaceae bacterium]|nr:TraR/DksA C4-type zinc finger protein [Lacipirellulaceae bacterium]